MRALLPEQVQAYLLQTPDWTLSADGRSMHRSLRFADFCSAFAFMTRVALAAERANHHPDWRNVYDRVDIRLSTHDVGGLTERDFALAAVVDEAAAALGGHSAAATA